MERKFCTTWNKIEYATLQDNSKVFLSAEVFFWGGGGSFWILTNKFSLGSCVLFGGQF
jgi:hypothetical protein